MFVPGVMPLQGRQTTGFWGPPDGSSAGAGLSRCKLQTEWCGREPGTGRYRCAAWEPGVEFSGQNTTLKAEKPERKKKEKRGGELATEGNVDKSSNNGISYAV